MELMGVNIFWLAAILLFLYVLCLFIYPFLRFVIPVILTPVVWILSSLIILVFKGIATLPFNDHKISSIEHSERNVWIFYENWRGFAFSGNRHFKKYQISVMILLIVGTASVLLVPDSNSISNVSIKNGFEQRLVAIDEGLNQKLNGSNDAEPVSLNEGSTDKYKLKPSYEGGSLREEPVEGTETDNVIRSISPDETLLFLGETEKQGNITWYKVKTQDDEYGWISGGIIEKVQ